MKSGKIFNFLTGSLTLCADGPFAERLINIFKNRGFPIWDIKRCGSCRILFKTDIPSFKHIRTPARRTKSRVRIIKRNGLPFILNRYRHRYFLAPGIAIFAVMLFYASTHIMGITIFGNTRIDTAVISSALGECGLYLGAKTSDIDNNVIRNKMMMKIDEIAWIGINANGSRVYVEIVERIEKENGLDKDGIACNIVAAKDGEIERLEIREGQTIVKTGSGVRKGDVLVSGIVDNSTNGFRYVKARGDVFAKTTYSKTQAFPLKYTETISTEKRKNKYSISILNFEIPLFFNDNVPFETYEFSEQINEFRLPIDIIPSLFIKKQSYVENISAEKTRTPAQAITDGTSILSAELRAELSKQAEVLEETSSHTLNEHGEVEVTVTLICRENIAEQTVIEKTLPDNTDEQS